MSPPNITYFLGAGASFKTIPIVDDFRKSLGELIGNPNNYRAGFENRGEIKNLDQQWRKIIEVLRFLNREIENQKSPDTVARRFFFKKVDPKNNEYLRLKAAIEVFILLLQHRKPTDPRYDFFWASVLQKGADSARVPSGLNFISWNYDTLLEKSLSTFLENPERAFNDVQSFPPIIRTGPDWKSFDPDSPLHVKLNGSVACAYDLNDRKDVHPARPSRNVGAAIGRTHETQGFAPDAQLLDHCESLIDEILETKLLARRTLSSIHYAWEEKSDYVTDGYYFDEVERRLNAVCKRTEILVVIGYSFPFFNRFKDREIFQKMGRLKKIYLNYPGEENCRAIEARLENYFGLKDVLISHEASVEEFPIPNEWDLGFPKPLGPVTVGK